MKCDIGNSKFDLFTIHIYNEFIIFSNVNKTLIF